MNARVLVYDIETAPNLGYIWAKWQQNVIAFDQEWFLLSFAWKWLGERKTHVLGLDSYPDYVPGSCDDAALTLDLWKLFDEADVTVTHNGKTFDRPKAQTRMFAHGMLPPSPHKEIDTLQVARKQFAFNSNSLKDLAIFSGIALKADPGGHQTWLGCMAGDADAWKRMKKYNKQDVVVEEQLYLRFRPWIANHPNLTLYEDKQGRCPKCLGGPLKPRGWKYATCTKRRQYQCAGCGGYSSGRAIERTTIQHIAG